MSEDTAVAEPTSEPTPAAEPQAPESPSASGLFSQQTSSPFDSFYSEDGGVVDTVSDGAFKNWLGKYAGKENAGAEANKSFSEFAKFASSRNPQPLGDDATQEEIEGHQQLMRTLKGVPEKAEDYKVEFEDGFQTTPDIDARIAEFGMEKGYSPKEMQELAPFYTEMMGKANEHATAEHFKREGEAIIEMAGGQKEWDQAKPGLEDFVTKNGGNLEDFAFSHAETVKGWQLAAQMSAKVAQLTGEDVSVKGENVGTSRDAIQSQIQEMQRGEGTYGPAFLHPGDHPGQGQKAQAHWHSLHQQLAANRR